MRTALLSAACLMLLAPSLGADDAKPNSVQETESKPVSCHGTAVEFVETPVEAAKLAAEQKKLVFVLHVSGHFEDPQLT